MRILIEIAEFLLFGAVVATMAAVAFRSQTGLSGGEFVALILVSALVLGTFMRYYDYFRDDPSDPPARPAP